MTTNNDQPCLHSGGEGYLATYLNVERPSERSRTSRTVLRRLGWRE